MSSKYNKLVFSNSSVNEHYPSGYCSSNKAFVEALRIEFEKFFNISTKVKYSKNLFNHEPITRINKSKILKKVSFQNKDNLIQYFSYYKNLFK